MPTPFTHLAVAQRLLDDPEVSNSARAFLLHQRPAFLLGNIAADARISDGVTRESTHFFAYDRPIETHPWRVMFAQHPALEHVSSEAQQAFLAGYVAHLSMDEIWSLEMVRPYFADGTWANRRQRFLMLHVILIYMDERDYDLLSSWQQSTLCAAQPQHWTPFLSDSALEDWRDFIGGQMPPAGDSQTLQVLGERLNMEPAELRVILDDDQRMRDDLWSNVPRTLLTEVETHMYDHARAQMMIYLDGR
ncbi:MAG: zinc dependent phospholipase C family protein [Anaerolineae bacterium]|nr:zinc dependent phospholipase C family protein [Anaerolineae bacterium]